jgi:competence protein ComEA
MILGLLGSGVIWLTSSPPRGEPVQLVPPPTDAPIQIHVVGEVNQPGVYKMLANQRVHNAIEAAGGFTKEADDQVINLAAPLVDGGQIYVPPKKPSAELEGTLDGNTGFQNPEAIDSFININTASQELLETLPGIGPVTAENIIMYRQNQGRFSRTEEIQKVPGIGPSTYEEIKNYITVDEP